MHKIKNERVHVFDLAGGLAIVFELLRGLTANQGPRKGDAPVHSCGTGLDTVRGVSRILARWGDGVEDHGDGLARGSEEGERIGDRLQIEGGRPAGDQDQVGRTGRFERRAVGMGRGVEIEQFAADLP